jgi:hypothetical protein
MAVVGAHLEAEPQEMLHLVDLAVVEAEQMEAL